jgi:hypothetical protein
VADDVGLQHLAGDVFAAWLLALVVAGYGLVARTRTLEDQLALALLPVLRVDEHGIGVGDSLGAHFQTSCFRPRFSPVRISRLLPRSMTRCVITEELMVILHLSMTYCKGNHLL